MEINGMKIVEGRMANLNLKDFLNPKFLEFLEKEMDNVKVIHIGIVSGPDEDQKLTSLAHINAEHANNNVLNVKVKEENDMDHILDIIKSFKKEE